MKKDSDFIEQVLEALEAMGDISIVQNYLFKNEQKFGHIKNEAVYLSDKHGKFQKVGKDVLKDKDMFLTAATKAYWIVIGKA